MLGASHLQLVNSDPSLFDPYFNSVVLLLGFEQSLNDPSPANSQVANGSSSNGFSYVTSPAKFDTYSIQLPRSAGYNYLDIANTSSFYFGTGDFTIETWIYTNSSNIWQTGNACVMDIANKLNGVQGGPSGFFLSTSSAGTVTSWKTAVYDNTAMGFTATTVVLPANTWHHIVTGRTGTTFYIGTNGTLQNVGTSNKNWFPYAPKIKQDAYNESQWGANLDEFRVTNGVWRYGTGTTYTVPTARFPRQ
jgi:hypothetical protein